MLKSLVLILLFVVALGAKALGEDPLFAAAVNYAAGGYSCSVFASDLDGDGDDTFGAAVDYATYFSGGAPVQRYI